MFDIEAKYLIALLNGNAKDRLKAIKGESVVNEANGISVTQAVVKLEEQVKNIMNNVSKDAEEKTHNKKSQNKSDINDETS